VQNLCKCVLDLNNCQPFCASRHVISMTSHVLVFSDADRDPHGADPGGRGWGDDAALLPVWEQRHPSQQVRVRQWGHTHQRQSNHTQVHTANGQFHNCQPWSFITVHGQLYVAIIFIWDNGLYFVYIWKWRSAHALGASRKWHLSLLLPIKPSLFYPHAHYASLGLPLSQINTIVKCFKMKCYYYIILKKLIFALKWI